jgi:hypothetical protein
MKKFFVISVIFLLVGVGSLVVALYMFKTHGQEKQGAESTTPKEAKEAGASSQVVYEKPKTIDQSTPDKAIQSYWEYIDYVRNGEKEPETKRYMNFKKAYGEYLAEIQSIEKPFLDIYFEREELAYGLERVQKPDPFFAYVIDPREAVQIEYRREIREVKLESDTRAKVECIIYNVTPLENLKGSLTPEEKSKRIKGADGLYIMEKFQHRWKIVDRIVRPPLELRDYWGEEIWITMWHNKRHHATYYSVYRWEN